MLHLYLSRGIGKIHYDSTDQNGSKTTHGPCVTCHVTQGCFDFTGWYIVEESCCYIEEFVGSRVSPRIMMAGSRQRL